MASTVVSICNSALVLIGADRISSLVEKSEEAAICNERYEIVRDVVLQLFPWNCLLTRKELPRHAEKPKFGYQYAYPLPTSPYCLSVLSMNESDDWTIEGDDLLTDSSSATILYVGKLTDTTKYPPYLADLVAARLALEISYKLSGSVDVQKVAMTLYASKLKEAIELESRQGNVPNSYNDMVVDSWISRR